MSKKRIRRWALACWAFAAVTGLAFLASLVAWVDLVMRLGSYTVGLDLGFASLKVWWMPGRLPQQAIYGFRASWVGLHHMNWLPQGVPGFEGCAVPLWMPLLALGAGATILTIRGRPFARGHCPSCNYDRSSLPPGSLLPCPECGATPPNH
jgi:hypothetical protein